jgi:hypothetical protein
MRSPGVDFELTNINDDPRFNDYWQNTTPSPNAVA